MNAKQLFKSLNFTNRKRAITEILNEKYPCHIVPADETEFVQLVINAHHRSHGDTIIHKLNIKPNPVYKHNNFFANYTSYGETFTDVIGIGSTLNATPKRDLVEIKKKKALQFMRWSTGPYTFNKRKKLFEKDPHCNICGCEVTLALSHLDHCGDVEFRHIADAWLQCNINKIEFKEHNGNCDTFTDWDLITDWYDFHADQSVFQLTCPTCNLRKSKA